MQSAAKSVDAYVKELLADRRDAIQAVRKVILRNLNPGFEEGMQYGMIGYYVPHALYPVGYHCDPKQPLPFACLASQKNYMSLYLMAQYGQPAEEKWLRDQFAKAGKKLDMGKSCVRFKKLEDLPLDVVGEAFRRITVAGYIQTYETNLNGSRSASTKKTTTQKPATKKAAKKTVKKAAKKASGKKAAR